MKAIGKEKAYLFIQAICQTVDRNKLFKVATDLGLNIDDLEELDDICIERLGFGLGLNGELINGYQDPLIDPKQAYTIVRKGTGAGFYPAYFKEWAWFDVSGKKIGDHAEIEAFYPPCSSCSAGRFYCVCPNTALPTGSPDVEERKRLETLYIMDVALRFGRWLTTEGHDATYSTFCDEFGYEWPSNAQMEAKDRPALYAQVVNVLRSAVPTSN